MKKKYSLIMVALLFISIIGSGFVPQTAAAGESWLIGWDYRKAVYINGSAGAGTNYQVGFEVLHIAGMQADFDDVRFTDNDGDTLLDYWIEEYSAIAGDSYFWVNVTDNLDSNQTIYMYYGNDAVSTTSDGDATFQEFYDKTDTAGWTVANGMTVTTSGDYLRFYDPVGETGVSYARRDDLVLSNSYEFMTRYKTVSISTDDQCQISIQDGIASSDIFASVFTPVAANQIIWNYYEGGVQLGGDWAEGTEYILTFQVDEGDSSTGINYRKFDSSRTPVDSHLGKAFALGSPTDTDTISFSTGTTTSELDLYMLWGAFRKCIDTEPVFAEWGEEETSPPYDWRDVGTVRFIFPIGWDPTFQFGYDAFFIFLGLIMIPASTMYMVRGGRKEFSTEKLFYGLILFCVGFALLVGGIMP